METRCRHSYSETRKGLFSHIKLETYLAIKLHIIANRLTPFTNIDGLNEQFGFLGGHSTEHALSSIQSDIYNGLNKKTVTTIMALDLQAAFDTIWHDGLIERLTHIGIPIILIKIIQCMLSCRTFTVRCGNFLSKMHEIVAGVPQGYVLGGTFLFHIFSL